MPNQASNRVKYLLATGAINFSSDTFKIILMGSGYSFNRDTHTGYSSVLSMELPTGNGYTAGGKALSGVSVYEDTVDDRCEVTWSSISWTASGGNIGPTVGAIIFDDTVTNDPIVGFIDFGGEYEQPNGGTLTIYNIEVRIT